MGTDERENESRKGADHFSMTILLCSLTIIIYLNHRRSRKRDLFHSIITVGHSVRANKSKYLLYERRKKKLKSTLFRIKKSIRPILIISIYLLKCVRIYIDLNQWIVYKEIRRILQNRFIGNSPAFGNIQMNWRHAIKLSLNEASNRYCQLLDDMQNFLGT